MYLARLDDWVDATNSSLVERKEKSEIVTEANCGQVLADYTNYPTTNA